MHQWLPKSMMGPGHCSTLGVANTMEDKNIDSTLLPDHRELIIRFWYSLLSFAKLGKAVPTTGLQGATHANNKDNRTEFYLKTSQRGISVDWSVYFFWHLFLQLLFKRKSEKKVTWIWVLTKRSRSGKRLIPRLSMLKDDALDAILQRFTIVTRKLGRV